MCMCVYVLTIQQKVFNFSTFALIPIVCMELVDKRSFRGLGGHHCQIGVRLHTPLRDVVIDINDPQLHLVQVPIWAWGIVQKKCQSCGY